MLGIDDIFIGFAISYLAGSIPSLKELFKKEGELTLQQRMSKCYEKALEKWEADDLIKQFVAKQRYSDINQLSSNVKSFEGADAVALKNLAELWADEMRNDMLCTQYLHEMELGKICSKIDRLDDYIKEREKIEEIHQIKRGLKEHDPVDGYIRRYCNSEHSENNYVYYALNLRQRHCLAEYVTGIIGTKANKFILYSSAQTGKTTELKQLCWELQQSELFFPVSYEVRNNTQLKREHLPEFRYYDGKEVVVVIDALDEVNGKTYDDLIEEISGYAYDHPKIKLVLSCRSNYRKENKLKQFCELYLEELSPKDAQDHINKELGHGNGLVNYIYENGLAGFARNPFFLNVLIDAYKNNEKHLPKNKAEIYRLFIERSYKNEIEEKDIPIAYRHSFDDSVVLLEKVALGLSLMNVQTLSKRELKRCLEDDDINVIECLRYDLIRCEGERYSFKHNAFREWLVANYLYREGLGRAKQLATHPNGRIKPEWYNIIMLWVSMYGKKDSDVVDAILVWLKSSSLDLIIYIDKNMVDKEVRDSVFKGLLLEYKSLGIRISNILQQDYKNILDFAQSEETVGFLIDELKEAKIDTAYYADLMCFCFFLDWDILSLQSPGTAEKLFQTLLDKTREALCNASKYELSFLYFDIPFFAKKDYLERIFEVVGNSNHYEAVRSMLQLIGATGLSDEYLDYILEKEHLVCNQREGNKTTIVTRSSVYYALGEVVSPEGIKRVLTHPVHNLQLLYQDEWSGYNQMMNKLLSRTGKYIKQGHGDLIEVVEKYYISLFKDYYIQFDRNKNSQELLSLIRQCYIDAGCRERGRKQFYCGLEVIFSPGYNDFDAYAKTRGIFAKSALWMTVDDVKNDFSKFSVTNGIDVAKANWYREIPFAEVAEYASKLYNEVFPEPESSIKRREIQTNSFRVLVDYEAFKKVVLEMVSQLDSSLTRRDFLHQLENLDDGFTQYAYRFIASFTDRNNGFDVNGIIQWIEDRDYYEAFFMSEIYQLMSHPNPYIAITDDIKDRCFNCAKSIVIRQCNNERPYYVKVALNLMLEGHFVVPNELLPNLLDYAKYSITQRDIDDFYNTEYSLFDYITEHVDAEVIMPIITKKMQADLNRKDYRSAYIFSKYIIEKREKKGYHLALQYALSEDALADNILDMLIKNGLLLVEIKNAIKSLPVDNRLCAYEAFVRSLDDDVWVKQQLEGEYKTYKGYSFTRALHLLTRIGSLDALDYLIANANRIKDGDDFQFNYDTPNAVSGLCFFIRLCYEKHFEGPFMLNTILASLERIAMRNEDSLNEVKQGLRVLTKEGVQFKYLNRYIRNIEDKYYDTYSGINDIDKVLDLINSNVNIIEDTGVELATKTEDDVEDMIYVSYNWESTSQHIVDHFCFVLETEKLDYKRDKKDCNYLDNIKEFMDAIRSGQIVVVVFSRSYLKSIYCMYELSGVLEDSAYKERILPVVTDDTIRESSFYKELFTYWKTELDNQKDLVDYIKSQDPEKAKPEEEKLKHIKAAYDVLPIVKEYLEWTNTENLDSLSFTHFKSIVEKIKDKKQKANGQPCI